MEYTPEEDWRMDRLKNCGNNKKKTKHDFSKPNNSWNHLSQDTSLFFFFSNKRILYMVGILCLVL